MTSHLQSKIESYCAAFDEHLQDLDAIAVPHRSRHFRKALCLSLLEALASGRFPSRGAKERFVKLVLRFGHWSQATHVSLVHLVKLLERLDDSAFDPARGTLYPKLQSAGSGGPVLIPEIDLPWPEACAAWPVSPTAKLLGETLSLDRLRLVELLYDYRNTLIHEARERTFSAENTEDEPFYESVGTSSDQQEWHLVFPYDFLRKLVAACVTNLRADFLATGRNPYAGHAFGYLMRPELNDIVGRPVFYPCDLTDFEPL